MSVYTNATHDAAISRIEVTPTARGNQAVLFLRDDNALEQVRTALANTPLEQTILTQSSVNGAPVLITQGGSTPDVFMKSLSEGSQWHLEKTKSGIDPWIIRAGLGLLGQGLVMRGSFKNSAASGKAVFNREQFFFALSNITANLINIGYGASTEEDEHQLKYLKEEINGELIDTVEADSLLSPADNRTSLRTGPEAKSVLGQINDTIKSYSSQISISLRYFGAFNLAKTGLRPEERAFSNLLKTSAVENKTRQMAGLACITGKTMAIAGKTEDPYDPTPRTWLDNLREKFFLGGGLMEAVAFGSLAVQNMNKEGVADRYFAAGNAVFVLAYISRSFATLGKKHLNMDELYAHVADSVAKVPEEEQLQTVADIAGMLKTHFGIADEITYADIFGCIASDLYKNHGVSIYENHQEERSEKTSIPAELANAPAPHVEAMDAVHTKPQAEPAQNLAIQA